MYCSLTKACINKYYIYILIVVFSMFDSQTSHTILAGERESVGLSFNPQCCTVSGPLGLPEKTLPLSHNLLVDSWGLLFIPQQSNSTLGTH